VRYLYLHISFIVTVYCLLVTANCNAQIITTVAGNGTQGYSGDGGQATNAKLNYPTGIAFDAGGNMFIADQLNNCIRKVTTAGIISTIAGTGFGAGTVSCTPCYSGDGGQATAAKLNNPTIITIDAIGNLYIADYANYRIRMVNTAGIISTIAGNGTAGYSGDGGQATNAELNASIDVVFDIAGNLYIADFYNYRVRKVTTTGIISTIAGNGTLGFSGDGGQATNAELDDLDGVCFDAAGNLYIADEGNSRIRMVNTAGIISTIAGDGTAGYSGDGGQATAAELYVPLQITFDAAGNLYLADAGNNRIRKVSHVGQMGVQQVTVNSEQLSVYPNPTTTNLSLTVSEGKGIAGMYMYDVLGNEVPISFQEKGNNTTIDISGLQNGVYFLSIQTNEGTETKKIIKQ
jgi:hypothetical protein